MSGSQDRPDPDPQQPRNTPEPSSRNPADSRPGSTQRGDSPRRSDSTQRGDSPDPGSRETGGSTGAGSTAQASRPRRRWRSVVRWGSLAVAGLLAIGVITGYLKYQSVWDSIHRITIGGLGSRPPQDNRSLNLLVFASGSTAGLTRQQQIAWHVGNDPDDNVSDTLMLVHLSPGRHAVTVVNIPRDTVVPMYSCPGGHRLRGQHADPSSFEQIGATLSSGGPECLWKTVEHQTGIRISHFLEVGYAGLVNVVNDVGGINVCVPAGVDDKLSGLRLSRGEHHIDGVTYLKFWRTREDTGTGSDLQRIQRDDYLLAQSLQQIVHADLLGNPSRLVHVVSDAAASLTTDSGLTQSDLLNIGQSLRGVPARDYQFIEASTEPYPPNTDWVQFAQPQSRQLFSAIAHDATRAGPARTSAPPPRTSPAGSTSAPGARSAPAGTRTAAAPARRPGAGVRGLAGKHGGITGTATCRTAMGAFTGPLSPG